MEDGEEALISQDWLLGGPSNQDINRKSFAKAVSSPQVLLRLKERVTHERAVIIRHSIFLKSGSSLPPTLP